MVILKRIAQDLNRAEIHGGRSQFPSEGNLLRFCHPRRYLVEYGWISREKDRSAYWLN